MRSITGLIGRFNRENYAVKAKTATIGIRGTHFVLAQCSNDCFNRDGSKAEDGLFGGVTDGRIAVSNDAGAKEFGKNEFFHVSSSNALPEPLLAPPSFLRDQLEGQVRGKKGKSKLTKEADGGESESGEVASGESGDGAVGEGSESASSATEQQTNTAVTTQPTDGAPVMVQLNNTQFSPGEQGVVQTNVSGGLINTVVSGGLINTVQVGQSFPYRIVMANAWAGTNSWSNAGGNGIRLFGYSDAWHDQGTLTILDPTKLVQAQDVLFADFVINQTPVTTFLMNAYTASGVSDYYYYAGETNCLNNCQGTLSGTVNFNWAKSASTNTGSAALAGNLSWGRYTHSASGNVLTGIYAGNTYNEVSYEHWLTGDPVNFAALPTAGTYSYSYAGGTRPTDQNGNMGTITSGGTVGLTFTGVGGANISLAGLAWTMPVTGNNYAVNFSNQAVTISQQPYNLTNAGWNDAGTSTFVTPVTVGATCQGACSNNATAIPVTSVVAPMLFGARAQGMGVAVSTSMAAVGASPAENTASVQAYSGSGNASDVMY